MAVSAFDPHASLEAENAVLGSLLIDGDIVREVLAEVREEDFLSPMNREIFQAARALFRAGKPVDPVTIRDRLGPDATDYLVQLMEVTPTSANWREYAAILREKATLSRAARLGQALMAAGDLESCRKAAAQLGQLLSGGRRLDSWTMPQLLDSFFKSQDPEAPPPEYMSFGLAALDEGSYIEPGDVVILGGYPSDGKTALALQMAWHMARKYRVGFFSLETGRKKLRDRVMAHVAQLDLGRIKRRELGEEAGEDLARRQAELAGRDLTLIEAAGMGAADIESASRAYGFQVIFIDYVQLVRPEGSGTRAELMAGVSRALHTFAQRTGTLVVELAQLSRPDKKTDKQGKEIVRDPNMHDLKESSQFEQDADMILMLFRPRPGETGPGDVELKEECHRYLKTAKNKEGRWGTWTLYFDGERQTFAVMAGDDGGRVLRGLQAAGRKARARARANRPVVKLPDREDGACFKC